MKVSATVSTMLGSLLTTAALAAAPQTGTEQVQQSVIEKQIAQLVKLQSLLEKKIEQNRKLVAEIKKERQALEQERAAFEQQIADEKNARYQALARVFEKMEPELAGDKITKIKNPKDAALIIYNMKSRSAGAVMNYVEPRRASSIVGILTDVKRPGKR
jgi:flagellar motility protein MotE (MotC chaperone)